MRRELILISILLFLFCCTQVSIAQPELPRISSPQLPIDTPQLPSPTPLPEVSLVGASFAVPDTIKDDVFSFRKTVTGIDLPSEAFLLATADDLYIVFADHSDKGLARVDGLLLPAQMQLFGMSIKVVLAKIVSFEKEGSLSTIREILGKPENYRFKLVKINAYRNQISLLYDPDEQPHIEFPLTIGYITEKPVEVEIVRKALEKAKEITLKVDEKLVMDLLEIKELQGLWIFNFEYEHWYSAQSITNGIVIPSTHQVFTIFEKSMPVLGKLLKISPIILYDVKTDLLYERVGSVVDLKKNSEKYQGKVVKLTVNSYGGYISVQEVIEHNTACGEEMAYIQDVGCVNLVADVRLNGFIVWNDISVPPRNEEFLLATGVSSFHQDEQFIVASGNFELIGKVVSAKEISDSLPEDVALIIYSAKKVSELDFEKLATQIKDEIKGRVGELYWALQDFYSFQKPPEIPFKLPRKIFSPKTIIFVATPKEIPEIVVERNFTIVIDVTDAPINLSISNSSISSISIKLKDVIKNVKIYFEKLIEKPPEVPNPPGLVYAYHKIELNVSENSIEKANITFWIPKEWLITYRVTKDDVVMLRYHRGEWMKLSTNDVGENATHFKFIAETPGFSIFAITAEQKEITPTPTPTSTTPKPTPTPTQAPRIPGFEAILTIAGLLAIAYLLRKKS